MPRRITLKSALTAALVASALGATPALAKPVDVAPSRAAAMAESTRTWSPGDNLPAYPTPEPSKVYKIDDGRSPDTMDAAKDAAIQPGQPTWPANPQVLTPPKAPAEQSASSNDDDGIWLVLGIGLAGAALAGGAGAARYARVRARRVAV
jgi:hypothetical protein